MQRPLTVAAPQVGPEEERAVLRVLRSGSLAQGPEVAAFEEDFSRALVPGRTCVAVSSGTAGLHLGLLAAGVGPGDEVVVPSFSFAATANAVALTGATPVFADIDPSTSCLDPAAVDAVITTRTAAIMPVHLYGHPADMTALCALAARRGLALFEDAAQAHGAAWQERPVGTFGRIAVFSLYPTKNMTSGEGGVVCVEDADLARAVRLLRNQGMERQYANEVVGFNARMTDLHAALGRVQLRRLPGFTAARRSVARALTERLAGTCGLTTPAVHPSAEPVWHQYTVRVAEDRDGVARALREEHGIGTGVYYPTPIHRLPAYDLELDLPQTLRASREVLSLPVHPGISAGDADRIADALVSVLGAGR
ncbi:DegT/DnrJ/EryC1/StrS aminotransferase family protein [Quadrisphaera sp. DSM 44207]|uniref:DegT/DnrJ/EryC1/StrS family aminotransferase n=1 Tax=Quadrisphaera sp. DSM 44207 TaxID=1881057 RepID=UPI001C409354|nr:DegT/DnrJ/EryC1/StrS family aminotransferase [Quadrisphaera sp. DSM 44207]